MENIRKIVKQNVQSQNGLENKLLKIIREKDLSQYQTTIKKMAAKAEIDSLDYAAALLYLRQENAKISYDNKTFKSEQARACALVNLRMLWYRLEVGQEHQLTVEGLKQLLVEESGVENRLIGRVDIFEKHTLIQIPNGIPQELLQHLQTVTFNQQKLAIKRLKNRANRRSRKIRNKGKRSGYLDNKSVERSDENQKQTQIEGSASDKGVAAHFFAKS